MTDQDVTIGELYRAVVRLETAAVKNTEAISALAALTARVHHAEERIDRIEPKLDAIAVNAGFIAGGVSVLGFLIHMLWR